MKLENGVFTDDNGNIASVKYFGSEDAARRALESLKNCSGCSGCSDCFGCYGCSRCSGCSDCFGCYGCSRCSGCSDCFDEGNTEGTLNIPTIPNIHQTIYNAVSQPKALDMSTWHTCETTHCRAGWVVTLAGESGRKLEDKTSTLFAAMQIYKASGYEISPCLFFDSNEKAMVDMKRLAEQS